MREICIAAAATAVLYTHLEQVADGTVAYLTRFVAFYSWLFEYLGLSQHSANFSRAVDIVSIVIVIAGVHALTVRVQAFLKRCLTTDDRA